MSYTVKSCGLVQSPW